MSGATFYDISKDFRFKQARTFLKENNYDDSIDLFVSLLKSCEETYGVESPQAAAAWYEYGNVLLLKEEENPANGVLGNVQADPSGAVPEDDDVGDEDEPDGSAEPVDGEVEGDVEEEDEPEGDLQIAWEALDVARNILSKQDDAQRNILLSDVHMRLGDLNRFNDNIAGALEEYQSALYIRNAICEPYDSAVSDSHFSLAVAYIYNAAEDTVEDPLSEKKKALVHYNKARESIVKWIEVHANATSLQGAHVKSEAAEANGSSSSGSSEAKEGAEVELAVLRADKLELADMLQETVDALKLEIEEMEKGNAVSSAAAGVTTIGFGQPSSSFSSSSSSSNAFSAASSSSSAGKPVNAISSATSSSSSSSRTIFGAPSAGAVAAPVAEVNTVQVKRKPKRSLEEDAASAVTAKK